MLLHCLEMEQINITQPIDNAFVEGSTGYIDDVEKKIKEYPKNETLESLINTGGGDITHGRRLFRAVLEHEGETIANVIGQAASMGGLLLAAFDKVRMDIHSRGMLHKGRLADNSKASESDKKEIQVFNETAHALLLAKAEKNAQINDKIDLQKAKAVLDQIFLSDSIEDYWFSAIEMRDVLGIVDEVTDVKRDQGKPELKLVAMANDYKNKFLNSFNNMGLFSKTKSVPRVMNIKDGRSIVFNSDSKELQKGDKIAVVDSDEVINETLPISDTLTAEVKENEVVDLINEEPSEPIKSQLDEVAKEEVMAMIQEMLAPIMEKLKEMGGAEDMEAKKKKEEEMENAIDEKIEAAAKSLFNKTQKQIVDGYKVPKFEGKNESVFEGMSHKEKQVVKTVEFVNENLNK